MQAQEIVQQGKELYETLRRTEQKPTWTDDLFFQACAALERLIVTIDDFVKIKQCADGGTPLLSNQGQALDGYSELANYRSIIEKFIKEQKNGSKTTRESD